MPLLKDFPKGRLDALSSAADWKRYRAGDVIARQNETENLVYFVASGFVKILAGGDFNDVVQAAGRSESRSRARHQVMLALLGPGDLCGEVSSLLKTGRCASIVALTPCEVISIPGEVFLSSMKTHPPFAFAVACKMARRLVDANHQVELMRGGLEDRIHAMIRHCQSMGLDIERYLSNAEIARMVGASRVAVSQITSRLRAERSGSDRKT